MDLVRPMAFTASYASKPCIPLTHEASLALWLLSNIPLSSSSMALYRTSYLSHSPSLGIPMPSVGSASNLLGTPSSGKAVLSTIVVLAAAVFPAPPCPLVFGSAVPSSQRALPSRYSAGSVNLTLPGA